MLQTSRFHLVLLHPTLMSHFKLRTRSGVNWKCRNQCFTARGNILNIPFSHWSMEALQRATPSMTNKEREKFPRQLKRAVHITCNPSNRNNNRPARRVTSGILAGRLQNDSLIEEWSAAGLNTWGRSGKKLWLQLRKCTFRKINKCGQKTPVEYRPPASYFTEQCRRPHARCLRNAILIQAKSNYCWA